MRRTVRALVIVFMVVAGGCGDDDGPGGATTTAPPTTAATTTGEALVADFRYDVALNPAGDFCVPGTASFFDLSTGGPTGWLWEFPDGSTSTEQNPTLDSIANDVEVTLTVSRDGTTATVTKDVSYPVC